LTTNEFKYWIQGWQTLDPTPLPLGAWKSHVDMCIGSHRRGFRGRKQDRERSGQWSESDV